MQQDKKENTTFYLSLSPQINENVDKDGVYDDALNWAIKEESVKNIALTGIYGSGKSSILKKFQQNNKDYEDYHFLEISLANFEWEIFEKETKRINENDEQQNIGGSNFSNIDKSNNQQSIDFHNDEINNIETNFTTAILSC